MKVGIVGEIHPSGYEVFDKNNIEYLVTNNIGENHLIEKLRDVDGIVVRTAEINKNILSQACLLYTSPSPRDKRQSRMPSSA